MTNVKNVNEVFEILAKPFAPEDIEWRIGRKSKDGTKAEVLAYMNARAVQERLDEAVGFGMWDVSTSPVDLGEVKRETRNGVVTVPLKGFICTIELTCMDDNGNFMKVRREDVSQCTDFEPIKGGASGAFKRAASMFGIGRYLYKLPTQWVAIDKYGNFKPPALPSWALPEGYSPTKVEQATVSSEPSYEDWSEVIPPVDDFSSFEAPVENDPVITFGKYNGRKISDVFSTDRSYVEWLAANSKNQVVRNAALKLVG